MRPPRRRGPCSICNHPEVVRIDYLIAKGAQLKPLARQFKISDDALYRHAKRHVTLEYRRHVQLGPFQSEEHLRRLCAEAGTSVLDNLRSIYSGLASRWLVNYEAGADDKLALLTGKLHDNLTLQAKLTKELAPTPSLVVNNVFALPVFADLQNALLQALAEHSEARAAVIRAFRELEAKAPPLIEVPDTRAA